MLFRLESYEHLNLSDIMLLTAKSAKQAQRTQRADAFIMNALAFGIWLLACVRPQQINKSTNQPL
jgi:hypothetical protein